LRDTSVCDAHSVGSNEELRLLRYRLVEVLFELAAAPEEQIAYFDRD
jgi:hypothetical protein